MDINRLLSMGEINRTISYTLNLNYIIDAAATIF